MMFIALVLLTIDEVADPMEMATAFKTATQKLKG